MVYSLISQHCFGIYCVQTGDIKLTRLGTDGKESIIRIVSDGGIIGHRSLFDHNLYSGTATVINDASVCFFPKDFILNFIREAPSVSLKLIEMLSHDMGVAEHRISSFHQRNVRERLAELLLSLKESHGKKLSETDCLINLKLTREEMATMIGTAHETVIRYISEFKEEGILGQSGKHLIVLNQEKLLEWANILD